MIRFFKRLWLEFRIVEVESQRGTADARHELDQLTDEELEAEHARIDGELAELRRKLESL